MKHYIDTATQQVWAFEDDGSDIFSYPNTPSTLIPHIIPAASLADLLDEAKTTQIRIVDQSCKDAIVSGFMSSALGSEHAYPSKSTDQTNLIGAVASGSPEILFWCANADGAWGMRSHTDVQIKQVLADAVTQRMAYSAKLAGLVETINSATTSSDVVVVEW